MDFLIHMIADASAAGDTLQTIASTFITSESPTDEAIVLPTIIEYGALISGAVSGAMTACDKRLDIMGVAVLALVTGLGGGLLRDIILPTSSVYMIDNPATMVLCIALGLAAFFFAGLFYKLDRPIAVADIISVALFSVTGADKTLMAGYGLVTCAFLGTITAVGGGMLRDISLGRTPAIFKSGNYYAICALFGAIVYTGLVDLHCAKTFAAAVSVLVAIGLRWASLRYNLVTVSPVDLTPRVVGPISRLLHRTKGHKGPLVTFIDDPAVNTTDKTGGGTL